MTKDEHWLHGAASILRADTGDLRKLTEIAGCDPATFYIGTCMDGVDMRGQDLRGMKFSDFDVTKVLIDADTKLDPEFLAKRSSD